jgi:ABC-type nitrate/sulfonate/bicarbonate transport system permease component
MILRHLRRNWPLLAGPVIILGGWEFASRTELVRPFFFPPPTAIAARSLILFDAEGGLGTDLFATVVRLLVVAGLAAACGISLGLLMSAWRWLNRGLETVLAFLYPIPAILFLPFLSFLIGRGETAIILTATITPFIIMTIYTLAGIRTIDPTLLEAAVNYGAKGWRFFSRVLVPGALTSIVTGFKISLGFSLITVIAIEMVAASNGLGSFLWTNWQILRVTDMYVALVGIAALGVLSSVGFDAVTNWLLPWRTAAEESR